MPSSRQSRHFAPSEWAWIAHACRGGGWVCQGCLIEIYEACGSENFEGHYDSRRVETIARTNGKSTRQFRRICVEHQLSILEERGYCETGPEKARREFTRYRDQLLRVIASL